MIPTGVMPSLLTASYRYSRGVRLAFWTFPKCWKYFRRLKKLAFCQRYQFSIESSPPICGGLRSVSALEVSDFLFTTVYFQPCLTIVLICIPIPQTLLPLPPPFPIPTGSVGDCVDQ